MTEDMCYIARYFGFEKPVAISDVNSVYLSKHHWFKLNPLIGDNSTYKSLLTRLTNTIYPVFETDHER